jgi:hypothetical protein
MNKRPTRPKQRPGVLLGLDFDDLYDLQLFIEAEILDTTHLLKAAPTQNHAPSSCAKHDPCRAWGVEIDDASFLEKPDHPAREQCQETFDCRPEDYKQAMAILRARAMANVAKRLKEHKTPTPVSHAFFELDPSSSLTYIKTKSNTRYFMAISQAEQDQDRMFRKFKRQVCDTLQIEPSQCTLFVSGSNEELNDGITWREATKQVHCSSNPAITLKINDNTNPRLHTPELETRGDNRKRRRSSSGDSDAEEPVSGRRRVGQDERGQHLGQSNHSPTPDSLSYTPRASDPLALVLEMAA